MLYPFLKSSLEFFQWFLQNLRFMPSWMSLSIHSIFLWPSYPVPPVTQHYYCLQKGMSLEVTFCHILTHYCRFSRANDGLLLMEEARPGFYFLPLCLSHVLRSDAHPTNHSRTSLFLVSTAHPLPVSLQWFNGLFKTLFSHWKEYSAVLERVLMKTPLAGFDLVKFPRALVTADILSSPTLLQAHRLWHVLQTAETIPPSKS